MDPLTAGALMGGGSLLGGIISANMTNQANEGMVGQQEDFQEEMSDTSYQRGVADMKAAGINPMLAATNGGASTPPGAIAPMTAPNISGAISSGADTALAMRAQNNQVQLQGAQIENTNQDTLNKVATEALTKNQNSAMALDMQQKSMANKVLSKTLDAQIKKANAEGNYAELNQILGLVNSGASSAKSLLGIGADLSGVASGLTSKGVKTPIGFHP